MQKIVYIIILCHDNTTPIIIMSKILFRHVSFVSISRVHRILQKFTAAATVTN